MIRWQSLGGSACLLMSLWLAMVLMPSGAIAQSPRFITVEVDAELTPAQKLALERVISPPIDRLVSDEATKAFSVKEFCVAFPCSAADKSALEGLAQMPNRDIEILRLLTNEGSVDSDPDLNFQMEKGLRDQIDRITGIGEGNGGGGRAPASAETPQVPPSSQNSAFLTMRQKSPIYEAWKGKLDPPLDAPAPTDLVVVPVDDQRLLQALMDGSIRLEDSSPLAGGIAISDVSASEQSGKVLAVIEKDVSVLGSSERQFQVSALATDEDIAALTEAFAASGGTAFTQNSIQNSFHLETPIDGVTFEAGSAECQIGRQDWPFDVDRVAEVISRNSDVIRRMGIHHLKRSNILIVDTGLGRELAEKPSFAPFLSLEISELLFADTFKQDTTNQPNSQMCLDVDGRETYSDAYGFSPLEDDVNCNTASSIDRIAPAERNANGVSPPYFPGHGSFVGTLATGGIELSQKVDGLDRNLGLTFARITKRSKDPQSTVMAEIADLQHALRYAVARDVDIINMSLKTNSQQHMNNASSALANFKGLVVAAAGNQPVQLAVNSNQFPAVLQDSTRKEGRLIVVGALGVDGDYWSDSAFSSDFVDIAAPGENVLSYDESGQQICMSGTSAAAPIVSFVAGMLKSFGLEQSGETTHRILSTADNDSSLSSEVKDGRKLNVTAALDVFVDQIWPVSNPNEPIRAIIKGNVGYSAVKGMVQLCTKRLATVRGAKGYFDPAIVASWTRKDQQSATLWAREPNAGPLVSASCFPAVNDAFGSPVKIEYLNLDTGRMETIALSEVRRIVPTPFRRAIDASIAHHRE